MSFFALVSFKGTDLTEISEQSQKVFGLYQIKKEKKERKRVWRETHLRSAPNLLFLYGCCRRWPLRAVVWMYQPNASFAAFILADHCRHTNAGVVVHDRAQLDALNDRPIGSAIFHFGDQIKMSGEDFFDVSHQPQMWQNDFFLVCSELYRPVFSCFVILLKPISSFYRCITDVWNFRLFVPL